MTTTSAARSAASVPCPIGTCHGLNSPHWPRMVTSASSGMRHSWNMLSMFRQFPTPPDWVRNTPRAPPSQAPAIMATPSSSVVSRMERIAGSSRHSPISRACPPSGT